MVTKTRRIEKNVIRCAQTPGPSSQAVIKNNSLHIESETGPIYIVRQKHIRYYDILEGLHIFTIDTNYDMTFYNLVL